MTAEDRIRALPCWTGSIEIAPLTGGLSNDSYLVKDAAGRHVVRFGQDYPFHHVFRERELMTARAAHAAGFAPAVHYAEPGVMVTEFLGAKTYVAEDVRANIGRVAALMRALPPRDAESCLRRRLHVLGVPRHPRLCAHAGGRRQPQAGRAAALSGAGGRARARRRCRCRSSSVTTIFCRPISSTTASGSG